VHGILTVEDPDCHGETLMVAGCDVEHLDRRGLLLSEAGAVLGHVLHAARVARPEDATSDVLRAMLDVARGRPFVFVQGVVSPRHEASVEALARARQLYFGAVGSTLERQGARLTRTLVKNAFLTVGGVHPAQRVFVG
jgi:hypothetical protein